MGESPVSDAQWLAEQFECEVCAECGWDADRHRVAPDPLGLRHAWCSDPIPEDWPEAATAAELARRMALSTG